MASIIADNIIFLDQCKNIGSILGNVEFNNQSSNLGTVSNATFLGSSVNSGVISVSSQFLGNSTNIGVLSGTSNFSGSASNSGTIFGTIVFTGSSTNTGVISSNAIFLGRSVNYGTVAGATFFDEKALNVGTVRSATFKGDADNYGSVINDATFLDTTINYGAISGNANFYSVSYNNTTGVIHGSAFFGDSTINLGTVSGTATFGPSASNTGNISVSGNYVEINGYYSNGYFVKNKVTPLTGNSLAPYQAADNSLYYLYLSTGQVIGLANNYFSSGYYSNGSRTTLPLSSYNKSIRAYDNNTFYIFNTGGSTSSLANGYYSNGYFVSGSYFAINNSTIPYLTVDDSKYYLYNQNGVVNSLATGLFSNVNVVNGVLTPLSSYKLPLLASDNNLYYQYLSTGAAVGLANDYYSNGRYSGGRIISFTQYKKAYKAFDNGLYYTYFQNGNVKALANGFYSNGYFQLGIISPTTPNVPTSVLDDTAVYTFNSSGSSLGLAYDYYSTGHYDNGSISPVLSANIPYLTIDTSKYYMYYSDGTPQGIANDYFSIGYYFNGVKQTAAVSTPKTAYDNNLQYTYNSAGDAVLYGNFKSGYFSNGFFINNVVSPLTATNSIPYVASDNSLYYTYTTGGNIVGLAAGYYSVGYFENGITSLVYITYPIKAVNNNLYYLYSSNGNVSSLGSGYYSNAYFVSGSLGQVVDGLPHKAANNNLYYMYLTSGSASNLANGYYSDAYYLSGNRSTVSQFTTPKLAQNNSLYYMYLSTGLVNSLANNRYSTGNFVSGAKTSAGISYPLSAVDNGTYYIYNSAGNATTASGYYSNGYFVSGSFASVSAISLPIRANDNNTYYMYTSSGSVSTTANGFYSTGYFVSGLVSTVSSNATPRKALNNNLYYVYNSNGTVNALANTYYSIGYYQNGSLSNVSVNFPLNAVDNNVYYIYNSNGTVSGIANGYYSNAYIVNGYVSVVSSYATPKIALDNSKYYTYNYNGNLTTLANNYYSNGYYLSGIKTGVSYLYPLSAADNSLFYIYNSAGNAASLANNYYSNGYYVNGVKQLSANNTPHQAVDDGLMYTYDNTGSPVQYVVVDNSIINPVSDNTYGYDFSYGSYVNKVSNDLILGTNDFTLEFFANVKSGNQLNSYPLIDLRNDNGGNGFLSYIYPYNNGYKVGLNSELYGEWLNDRNFQNPFITNSYAASFDVNSTIEFVSNNMAFGTGDFTIEMWAYIESADYNHYMFFDTRTYSFEGFVVYMSPYSGIGTLQTYSTTYGHIVQVPNKISFNRWQHIAVSRESSTLRIFVNGKKASEITYSANLVGNQLIINDIYTRNNPNKGKASNVRVIKNQALYKSDFTVPNKPLTTTGYGSTSQNITGTVVLLGLQSSSIDNVFSNVNNVSMITLDSDSHQTLDCNNGGIGFSKGYGLLDINVWNHYALVRNNGRLYVYINGNNVYDNIYDANITSNYLYINTNRFTGDSSDTKYSNLRLVKNQALYTCDFNPPSEKLTNTGYGTTSQNITGTVALLALKNSTLDSGFSTYGTVSSFGLYKVNYDGIGKTDNGITFIGTLSSDIYYKINTPYGYNYINLQPIAYDFTIECMVKASSFNDYGGVSLLVGSMLPDGYEAIAWSFGPISNGLLRFFYGDNITSTNTLTPSAWNHIAFVYKQSTNTAKLFLNGNLEAEQAIYYIPDNSSYGLTMGRFSNVSINSGTQISNLRITKDALYNSNFIVAKRPTKVKNTSKTRLLTFRDDSYIDETSSYKLIRKDLTLPANLLLDLNFDQGLDNNSLYDTTVSLYNASYSSTSGLSGSGAVNLNYGSLVINGDVLNQFNFGSDDYTIEFYVNLRNYNTAAMLFEARDGNQNYPSIQFSYGTNILSVNGFGSNSGITGTISVSLNQWHKVVMQRKNGKIWLFVDDQISGSVRDTSSYIVGSQILFGGIYYDASSWSIDGLIDKIKVTRGVGLYSVPVLNPTQELYIRNWNVNYLGLDGYGNPIESGDESQYGWNLAYTNVQFDSNTYHEGEYSIAFNGTDSYATFNCGTGELSVGSSDWLVDLWLSPNNASGNTAQRIFSMIDQTTYAETISIELNQYNQIVGSAVTNNGTVSLSGGSISSYNWHRIQFLRKNNNHYLFIDGVIKSNSTNSGSINFTGNEIGILGAWLSSNGYSRYYNGNMDSIRISRNASIIQQVFSTNELLLRMEGSNGSTNFIDEGGNNLTVTAHGGANISTSQHAYGNSSALFNGTSAYLSMPHTSALDLGTGDFTVGFSVYFLDYYDDFCISNGRGSNTSPSDNTYYAWACRGFGNIWTSNNRINAGVYRVFPFSRYPNTWYDFKYVRSSGRLGLFINGIQVQVTYPDTNNYSKVNSNDLVIGGSSFLSPTQEINTFFNGYIDNVYVRKGSNSTDTIYPYLRNGYDSNEGIYYINDIATNLDYSGSNYWLGTGTGSNPYYTTWEGVFYQNGSPFSGNLFYQDEYSNYWSVIFTDGYISFVGL